MPSGTTPVLRTPRWRRPLLRPSRRVLAALLLAALAGGAAVVVWLWWHDTPAGRWRASGPS
jgi:ferric-dicitrate binding protein FerR (iron transport regulator)